MNCNSSVHRTAAGQLVSTTWTGTNGLLRLRNEYDYGGRRVRRILENSADAGAAWTVIGNRTFAYDDWNLLHERSERPSEGAAELAYFWGPDLSGSLQGAGGVGGLVAVSIAGQFYFPGYDNNGNVIGYWDESGSLVAEYIYDAFGNTIDSSGSMASVFPHRFSTKYCDAKTDLYYYGYRYYSPSLGRWISRDPIEEMGGINLLCFCNNGQLFSVDSLGELILLFDAPPQSGPNQSVHEAKIWEGRRKIMLFAMKLLTVSQSKWDTLSREGKIYFKDQVFRDTRSAYTQKVLRELLSVVIRPSDNSPQHYLETLEKWIPFADKPYDWVVFAIHGVAFWPFAPLFPNASDQQ